MKVWRSSRISAKRRRFLLKALSATPWLPASLAGCGQSAKPKENEKRPATSTEAEIQALTAVIRCKYGSQLTDQQLLGIESDIESNLRSRERLRVVRLRNSDEPDVIFRAVI